MSQITKTSLALALALLAFLGVLSLAGCGDTNKFSNYDPDAGKHPAGWLPAGHAVGAITNLESCRSCHGQDFSGGISKVPCALCHLGTVGVVAGVATPPGIHPAEWDLHGDLGYALHASYVQLHGAAACSNIYCHGANLGGVPGSGPSCSSCHMGGPFSVHPAVWQNEIALHGGFVLQNGTAGCRNAVCHGPQLQGVFLSGPACNDCHHFATPIPDVPVVPPAAVAEVRARYAEYRLKKAH